MTWVKICGLRRSREVEAAVEAGADAVGFVLADSPRRVDVAEARRLGKGIAALRIVVTVDLTPGELLEAARLAEADGVQPHGAHSAEAAAAGSAQGLLVLRPVPVHGPTTLHHIPKRQIPLLDAYRPGRHGGTGIPFDWGLVRAEGRPFVLAGGLAPENVAAAVAVVKPWGVDASSGLESAPGKKDPALIRAFLEEAKRG